MVDNEVLYLFQETDSRRGGASMVTGWRGGDRRFRKISEEQSGNVSSSSSSRTGATLPGSSGFNGNPGVAHRTTLCVLPHCQSTC